MSKRSVCYAAAARGASESKWRRGERGAAARPRILDESGVVCWSVSGHRLSQHRPQPTTCLFVLVGEWRMLPRFQLHMGLDVRRAEQQHVKR